MTEIIDPSPYNGCRVLVVEDTGSHQRLAEAVLGRLGMQSMIASNSDEAIAYFREHKPDLILMDLQMPAKSGYEITYEIRRLEHEGQRPRTPIVALTSYVTDDAPKRCAKAGTDDCVSKPLSIELCQDMAARHIIAKPEA